MTTRYYQLMLVLSLRNSLEHIYIYSMKININNIITTILDKHLPLFLYDQNWRSHILYLAKTKIKKETMDY